MIEQFFEKEPYSLCKEEKTEMLTAELKELTEHHKKCCREYSSILTAMGYSSDSVSTYYDLPFIPVRVFKEMELLSIERKAVFKTMTSSGTTGQAVSKIFVDKNTAANQQKTLIKILTSFTGKERLPMLIIDSPAVIKNREMFSARGAAILGLSMLAREKTFVLNDDMSINMDVFNEFVEKNKGKKFLIFGFTFMVWQHFYNEMVNKNLFFAFKDSWLITGGGWKKLVSASISRDDFKQKITEQFGIVNFLDHYGMVEQTGSIYAECPCGYMHTSIYSDVIVRKATDFSVCEKGEEGIIQLVSVLPRSYPGHSILTEDQGIILGEDDCPCGRKGKYFKLTGRIRKAELRGCSDTYAAKFN